MWHNFNKFISILPEYINFLHSLDFKSLVMKEYKSKWKNDSKSKSDIPDRNLPIVLVCDWKIILHMSNWNMTYIKVFESQVCL